MLDKLKEVKYFKEIKRLKKLQTNLEFRIGVFRTQVSIYDEGFCEYTQQLTIFTMNPLS